MKKRGQFYLVAVIVLIGIFFALVTVENSLSKRRASPVFDLENELKIERSNTLDYIAENNLTGSSAENILVNFSNLYLEKIGKNKDSIFMIGGESSVKVTGYNSNLTSLYYGTDGEEYEINQDGEFEYSLTPASNLVYVKIDEKQYNFTANQGMNINYIINYMENDEIHILKSVD